MPKTFVKGMPQASVEMPRVTEFKYLGSTLQSNGGVDVEVNRRTKWGWNN